MLTGRKTSDKEYDHVLKVWSKCEMNTMRDYHDLCLICDVLLLADVLEKFLHNSLKNYGLCPSQYFSVPPLSQDALLNITKEELELISDLGMYIFFEKCMRGRVSHISNRYRESNNRYLKSYGPRQ